MVNRDVDDEPWPIPAPVHVRHLTRKEQRTMDRAMRRSLKLIEEKPVLDEDGRPLPPRPWEPPGPQPRRRITFGRPMVIVVALVALAVFALWAFGASDGRFGIGVG